MASSKLLNTQFAKLSGRLASCSLPFSLEREMAVIVVALIVLFYLAIAAYFIAMFDIFEEQ
jgi:phage shock protein PspC (stress-responsive transcriptional regulator)